MLCSVAFSNDDANCCSVSNLVQRVDLPPSKAVHILLNNELFSDIKFTVEGSTIFAHKVIRLKKEENHLLVMFYFCLF